MRIALDTQSTLDQKTGIGHYTDNLLATLQRVDHEHEFVSLNWGQVPTMRIDRRLRWQQIELPRHAKSANAQILHVTGFDAPRFKPCPVVLTVHDLIGALFPKQFPPIARFYWGWWLPHSVRWADAIITDSENTRHDIQRLTGISSNRVTVIPLGVDPRFFEPNTQQDLDDIQRSYDLPPEFLLYIGTLEPRKGLDTLLSAFSHLAADIDIDLVIVGKKGWATDPIFQQVTNLGLASRIHFTGYVPDDDLPALYRAADLFVFPSRYEGFGLPPLEAMACSTPVICSNASSLPEVVGDSAITVPPDDVIALTHAIRDVLANPEIQVELKKRGLKRASLFTWDETARKTVKVYENLYFQTLNVRD